MRAKCRSFTRSSGSIIGKPRFDRGSVDEVDIHSASPHTHLHHKAGSLSGKRALEDQTYFKEILSVASAAQEWLITGPSSAKVELVKHVHRQAPHLIDRIVGIGSTDHPSDRQIVAHARSYFRQADSMWDAV